MKLASWRTPVREELMEFVHAVSAPDSADFVPAPDRIAVFDNDGTLWTEQPAFVQAYFLRDRVEAMLRDDATLADDPNIAALLAGGPALEEIGKRGVVELVSRTHAGMSAEAFDAMVREWFACARHPDLDRPFAACTYAPMRELLDLLRERGFGVYIVTGGGIDFVRAISEEVYGVPRANVIGSSGPARFADHVERTTIEKLPGVSSFDDREVKPENIHLHIGRRPILAFGNSDGDLAMLLYTLGAPGRRAAYLLHHDDPDREREYDRDFALSPLDQALDVGPERGVRVVSMKSAFAEVFGPDDEPCGRVRGRFELSQLSGTRKLR